MLNGASNENGDKINRSNSKHKKTNWHVQHTFLYFSLPLLCSTTMLFCMAKGDVTREDPQRRFLVQHSVATLMQHCCDIVSNSYNIVPTLQRCVKVWVAMRYPAKNTSSCLWYHICFIKIELFYIGMPVMQTDGRTGVRSRDNQKNKITNFLKVVLLACVAGGIVWVPD